MVSNLSVGKRGSEDVDEILKAVADRAQELKDALIKAVDEDTNAFNAYMAARRLPDKSTQDKQKRQKAIQDGLKQAVAVPLRTARFSAEVIEIAQVVVEKGNVNSVTDAGVGAHIAFTGVKGGVFNVLINLREIEDKKYVEEMKQICADLELKSHQKLKVVMKIVDDKITKVMGG
jgi:formiminotetrahydrofolate cyclodeaminase